MSQTEAPTGLPIYCKDKPISDIQQNSVNYTDCAIIWSNKSTKSYQNNYAVLFYWECAASD